MNEMITQPCPRCQTVILLTPGYTTWCEHCGWNILPQEPNPARNIFETLYVSIGNRQGHHLFQEMVKAETLNSKLTISKILAFIFSTLVHSITLMFGLLGIFLIVRGWSSLLLILVGLFLLGIAWVLLPHLPKIQGEVISEDKAPTLYKLTKHISLALNTPPVEGIVINEWFNAAFSQVGWRRRRILYVGLPLFSVLDPQEKVALLGHELAHGVNRDPNRSFFVGSAVSSLAGWYDLLRPNVFYEGARPSFLAIGLNICLWVISRLPWLGAYFLSHLLWQDSQRAEYLADNLAAQIGGTEGMLSMLKKLHLNKPFFQIVEFASLSQEQKDIFNEMQQYVKNMPKREQQRLERVEQLETSRLDMTHPPTAYRVKILKTRPSYQPKVLLSAADAECLEKELASIRVQVQKQLFDLHKRSLYY